MTKTIPAGTEAFSPFFINMRYSGGGFLTNPKIIEVKEPSKKQLKVVGKKS